MPEDAGEEEDEAEEKVRVVACKLQLLLRRVATDLRTLRGRLVGPSFDHGPLEKDLYSAQL